MEIGARTIGIAGITIAILLFSALLIPIVSNAGENSVEIRHNYDDNTTAFYATGGPVVISYDGSEYSVNGESIGTLSLGAILSFGPTHFLDTRGFKNYYNNTSDRISTGAEQPWRYELDANGSYRFYNVDLDPADEHLVSEGYDDINYIIHRVSGMGEYVFWYSDRYVNDNSFIFYVNSTGFANYQYYFAATADKPDFKVSYSNQSSTGRILNGGIATLTETADSGVYTISAEYISQISDVTDTLRMIVPADYVAPADPEGVEWNIISIIPLLALVGIVLATIYVTIGKNY